MKKSFISIISTDNYLNGLLVLYFSLLKTGTKYPFIVLLTPNISEETCSILDRLSIPYKRLLEDIYNPTDVNKEHRWFPTYSKLQIFNQTEYDKLVFLDADMLILKNVDELFDKPHLSATNAGSMLPRKASWTHLNSGLMVIEPSAETFEDMKSKVGKIEKIESGGTDQKPQYGSDQDFLNAYYPDWPNKEELHMDHKYNIFHYYLDEYCKLFNYGIKSESERPISIIHYASYLKPWHMSESDIAELEKDPERVLEAKTIRLWWEEFRNIK